MARVQPRSNIYTLMPILATLIMAAGIAVTWLRINEYYKPPKPTKLPPPAIREFPEPEEPVEKKEKGEAAPGEETKKEEGEAPKEKAPDEGEPAKAPGDAEKAPPDKEVAPPADKAPDEKAPAEAPKKAAKAEEEEAK